MFPNTFMMQELVRRYFDEVLDRQDEGEDIEIPSLYTIPKGEVEFPSPSGHYPPGHLVLKLTPVAQEPLFPAISS